MNNSFITFLQMVVPHADPVDFVLTTELLPVTGDATEVDAVAIMTNVSKYSNILDSTLQFLFFFRFLFHLEVEYKFFDIMKRIFKTVSFFRFLL